VAGNHPLAELRRVMRGGGAYVGVGAAGIQHLRGGGFRALGHFLGNKIGSLGSKQKVVVLFITRLNKADLTFLGQLVESGKVTPQVERRYELAEVGAALAYLNRGHARAKVVISVR